MAVPHKGRAAQELIQIPQTKHRYPPAFVLRPAIPEYEKSLRSRDRGDDLPKLLPAFAQSLPGVTWQDNLSVFLLDRPAKPRTEKDPHFSVGNGRVDRRRAAPPISALGLYSLVASSVPTPAFSPCSAGKANSGARRMLLNEMCYVEPLFF